MKSVSVIVYFIEHYPAEHHWRHKKSEMNKNPIAHASVEYYTVEEAKIYNSNISTYKCKILL